MSLQVGVVGSSAGACGFLGPVLLRVWGSASGSFSLLQGPGPEKFKLFRIDIIDKAKKV